MRSRGSISLEAGAAVLLSAMTLTMLAQIARASVAHLWFDHTLYQALICVAENKPAQICEQQAQAQAQQLPLGAQVVQIRLVKNHKDWQGDIRWQGSLKLKGHLNRQLNLEKIAKADLRWSACCF